MEAGRLNAYEAAPDAMRAVQRVEGYIQQCGLEKSLIELVKMRASQINGCAYCLHVHSTDARRAGETEQRLYLLDAWHESSLYTTASAPLLRGLKPSPGSRRRMHPTRSTTRFANISTIRNWSTPPR
jgi:AhpD family alkylhydroperoxidase